MKIKLYRLQQHCPLDCPIWHIYPAICKGEVDEAIAQNLLLAEPFDEHPWNVELNENRDNHIQRIAYLMVHGWSDAIKLDVGIPGLDCKADWFIDDGNHRYLAANFLGHEEIDVEFIGDLVYFKELFL